MPKLDLKAVQKELERGYSWPFYWVYGPEKLKSRELLKRIRKAVLGDKPSVWGEQILDGAEVHSTSVLDAARSPVLGVITPLVIVRDAHTLKNPETLSELFGPSQPLSALTSVCVCFSKDLDARKKFSKILQEKAAVVPCEEVPDSQRDSWISYLAKQKNLSLTPELSIRLCALEPWSLESVDQELEKFSLAESDVDVLLQEVGSTSGDEFLNGFFRRDLKAALPCVYLISRSPDQALPLLGLLNWNLKQMLLFNLDQKNGTQTLKLNPYFIDRLRKWSAYWSVSEIIRVQQDLAEIDFSMKQKPVLSLSLWTDLVMRYSKE